MDIEEVRQRLAAGKFKIASEDRIANGTGIRIKLSNGSIVNVYKTGKLSFQGQGADEVRAYFEDDGSQPTRSSVGNKVFVAYGHDETAKTQLEAMLRRWKLEPLFLDLLPSEGQTLIEKIEKYTTEVNYAVVLATPDDEGHAANKPDEKAFRARQNVVLELGVLLAKLGRKRVAILLKDQEKMERPSDIQGLIYIPFKNDIVKEAGVVLAKEMNTQGYNIEVKNL